MDTRFGQSEYFSRLFCSVFALCCVSVQNKAYRLFFNNQFLARLLKHLGLEKGLMSPAAVY